MADMVHSFSVEAYSGATAIPNLEITFTSITKYAGTFTTTGTTNMSGLLTINDSMGAQWTHTGSYTSGHENDDAYTEVSAITATATYMGITKSVTTTPTEVVLQFVSNTPSIDPPTDLDGEYLFGVNVFETPGSTPISGALCSFFAIERGEFSDEPRILSNSSEILGAHPSLAANIIGYTDAYGSFNFTAGESSATIVNVSKDGYNAISGGTVYGYAYYRSNNTIMMSRTSPYVPNIVSGHVYDDMGEPISNVSISIKGTNFRTTTDIDGYYNITYNGISELYIVFDTPGYNIETILVGQRNTIDVVMDSDLLSNYFLPRICDSVYQENYTLADVYYEILDMEDLICSGTTEFYSRPFVSLKESEVASIITESGDYDVLENDEMFPIRRGLLRVSKKHYNEDEALEYRILISNGEIKILDTEDYVYKGDSDNFRIIFQRNSNVMATYKTIWDYLYHHMGEDGDKDLDSFVSEFNNEGEERTANRMAVFSDDWFDALNNNDLFDGIMPVAIDSFFNAAQSCLSSSTHTLFSSTILADSVIGKGINFSQCFLPKQTTPNYYINLSKGVELLSYVGGNYSVTVISNDSWTASASSVPGWISIVGSATGSSGTNTLYYSVSAYNDPMNNSMRSGTINFIGRNGETNILYINQDPKPQYFTFGFDINPNDPRTYRFNIYFNNDASPVTSYGSNTMQAGVCDVSYGFNSQYSEGANVTVAIIATSDGVTSQIGRHTFNNVHYGDYLYVNPWVAEGGFFHHGNSSNPNAEATVSLYYQGENTYAYLECNEYCYWDGNVGNDLSDDNIIPIESHVVYIKVMDDISTNLPPKRGLVKVWGADDAINGGFYIAPGEEIYVNLANGNISNYVCRANVSLSINPNDYTSHYISFWLKGETIFSVTVNNESTPNRAITIFFENEESGNNNLTIQDGEVIITNHISDRCTYTYDVTNHSFNQNNY